MRVVSPPVFLTGLLLLAVSGAVGATVLPGYTARVWQVEDGLPHNVVQAITQTRDGYLWVGTRQGLARFDGVSFSAFDLTQGGAAPSVTALAAGADGGLWIGTAGSGLFRWREGKLTHYGAAEGLMCPDISRLISDGADGLWLATRDGLARWQNGTCTFLANPAVTKKMLLSLCLDNRGALWLGAARGVQRLDDQVTNFRLVTNSHPLRAIRSIFCDAAGRVWVGGGDGLTMIENDQLHYYPKGEGPTAIVTAVLRDRAGNVWVGTQGGLSRFVDGRFVEESPQEEMGSVIHALFEDREGSVWVGCAEGLVRLTARSFVTYTKQHGLSQNAISSVGEGSDGSIWIGTWGGGLDRLKDGNVVTYNKSNGLGSDFVVALEQARDGTVWVGLAFAHGGQGVDRLQDGRILTNKLITEQIGPAITALVEDEAGNMWAGSRSGLGCFHQGTLEIYTGRNEFTNNPINALCRSRDGGVWIGTEKGLVRWRRGAFEVPSGFKSPVLALYEDAEGELWIGTAGWGLVRFANGSFQSFSARQGLLSDSIFSVLEDRRRNLWMLSTKGLFRVGIEQFDQLARGAVPSLNCIAYGKADGFFGGGEWQETTELNQPAQPAACLGMDGRLWFRTSEGLAVTDPDRIVTNDAPPPVVIEKIIADRQTVPLADALSIAPGRGELEIDYTALSLRAPEKNRFRYRLEGVDSDWIEAGSRRAAYYNHLAPGRYTFSVRGCNDQGVWNKTGAVIGLGLKAHLWQTWWFLGLCGLSAVAGVAGGARYTTRLRMQRKLENLRQLHAIEAERARIARDMHDELGAKLARISFQGAIAVRSLDNRARAEEEIGKITHTARALVSSLDEIVWAVDPENDTLENLAGYICRYAGEFFQNSPMNCEFRIPANLPPCRLASDVRHNVFLAVKETLTNILKHSQAAHVEIRLDLDGNKLRITIADDGRGFNPGGPSASGGREGHGLANLRHRLQQINGTCAVASETGGGTRVTFVLPLPAGVSSNDMTIQAANLS